MKADAASGNQTTISTNTDSQSQNSGKRKMSEFSCNPGMQKHELFFLAIAQQYSTISKGGKWLLDYSKVLFPTGLVTVYARTVEVYY